MEGPSGAPFRAPPGLGPTDDVAATAAVARAAAAKREERLTQLGLRAPEDSVNEFTMVIDKTTGRKLGANVNAQDGVTLEIEAVTSELFKQWNEDHPELTVRRGDRIVEANGIRNDANQLLEQCSQNATLELVIKRGQVSELIEEITAVIENRVDARVNELRAWGTKVVGQMNSKMRENTAALFEGVARCREKAAWLEAENEELKKVLLLLAWRFQMLGAPSSSMTIAGPHAPAAASMAAESTASAAAVAGPSPGPRAGVAEAASPQEGASAPLPPSTPPRGRAASPWGDAPKVADVPPFLFPGPAAGAAPLSTGPHEQRAQLSPTTSRSPVSHGQFTGGPGPPSFSRRLRAAHPGAARPPPLPPVPEATGATRGQFTFTLRIADGGDLGLEFCRAGEEDVLRIERVHPEGAVGSWNRLCRGGRNAHRVVEEGDKLISVNNMWHDPDGMLQECEEKQLLTLTFARGERAP